VVTNVFQGPTTNNQTITGFTSYITNNDNAIYNSATFDLVGTYGNVLDFNGNGQIDVNERLVLGGREENGFIGYDGVAILIPRREWSLSG
jgi:hypothetical protein